MVPVGGSIVAGFDSKFIDAVSKTYPGKKISRAVESYLTANIIYTCSLSTCVSAEY